METTSVDFYNRRGLTFNRIKQQEILNNTNWLKNDVTCQHTITNTDRHGETFTHSTI